MRYVGSRRHRQSARRVAAIGLLFAGTLALTSGVSASDDADSTKDAADVTTSSLAHEAVLYAAEFGVSEAEAQRRLGLQPAIHEELNKLETMAPKRFAGGWIEHSPKFTGVASFTGDASSLDALIRSNLSVPIEIRSGARFSAADLAAAMDRIQPILDRNYPVVASEIDLKAGALNLHSPEILSSNDLDALEATAGVPLTFEQSPSDVPVHTYGGKKLSTAALPNGACTAGFTVRNTVTGATGLMTAAHCSNTVEYWLDAATHYPLTFFMAEAANAFSDIQWSRENIHNVYDDFFDGFGLSDVQGEVGRINALGDFVCHWGIGSALTANPVGLSCGQIDNISYDPGSWCGPGQVGPCNPSWVKVTGANLACFSGDSGGPVFGSGDAYGIVSLAHFSGKEKGQCVRLIFQSRDFNSGINLDILQ